jgi:hypothetical protein
MIHSLYAVRGICRKQGAKANLFIADLSYGIRRTENFKFDINSTYSDCCKLLMAQEYISSFSILPRDGVNELISVDLWRDAPQYKSWSLLLSEFYSFNIENPYSWIHVDLVDPNTHGHIMIHRSLLRRSNTINWRHLLSSENRFLFLTSKNNLSEYTEFVREFGCDHVKPYNVDTLWDMASAIKGSKLFIGNQSMPMALACALDVPRICELNPGQDSLFYFGETNYSKNISFQLKDGLLS